MVDFWLNEITFSKRIIFLCRSSYHLCWLLHMLIGTVNIAKDLKEKSSSAIFILIKGVYGWNSFPKLKQKCVYCTV